MGAVDRFDSTLRWTCLIVCPLTSSLATGALMNGRYALAAWAAAWCLAAIGCLRIRCSFGYLGWRHRRRQAREATS